MKKPKKELPLEIRIECAFDVMLDIDKLIPNPRNPNRHSDAQVAKLALLIKNHGWRHPITVSNRSGFVVAGHCRLMAAKLLELKTVPVDYQDFASEAEEWAVLIADNVVAELNETDGLKMAELLNELDTVNYPLELTALDTAQIEDYIDGPGMPPDSEKADLRPFNQTHILISFPPDKFVKMQPLLEELKKDEEFEIEQSSN